MANRNSSENKQGNTNANNPTQKIKGNGQQTGGLRGQKLEKSDEEGYRSEDKNRQRGNHGGNR